MIDFEEEAKKPLEELIADLGSDEDEVRGAASQVLREKHPDGAADALLGLLDSPNPYQIYEAAHLLADYKDPRAVEKLYPLLTSQWNDHRRAACWALGEIKDPGSLKVLIPLLGDLGEDGSDGLIFFSHEKSPPNRAVAQAVIKYGAKALDPVMAVLASGDVPAREAAAWILEAIGTPDQAEGLVSALGDPDPRVRWGVVEALGHVGVPEVVEPLCGMLKDPDRHVRWAAARKLGELADPRAVGPLQEALGDEMAMVRDEAERALRKFGDDLQVE